MKEILKQLTLEEKASLCSGKDFWNLKGIERLNIPSIMVTDGPHGLRKQDGSSDHVGLNASVKATCFPTASALASSWNPDLAKQVGDALGKECLQENVSVILGPGMNIKRSPLGGRNFEYFSEDPLLSAEMAIGLIDGVQAHGVGTSLKHYVANNQEHYRLTIDTLVDERTLREIYLKGFEDVVKRSQPYTLMCSYNKLNGTFVSEHKRALTEILRDEWGYNGMVVSDWGAVNDRIDGLNAGMDLQMPSAGDSIDLEIIKAVKKGTLKESQLDIVVERILDLIFKTRHVLENDFTYDVKSHHQLAQRAAEESIVLLKNDDILPIKESKKITVIGEFAKTVRYQGSGSSQINPHQVDSFYDAIVSKENFKDATFSQGYDRYKDQVDHKLINDAVEKALNADIVLLFAGLTETYESEGFDRKHLNLPKNHDALIDAVSKVNDNVVVVLSNGAPVEMPWINQVSAVIEGYLTGQAGANALADIIDGTVNPSGKLAETFPIKLSDNSSHDFFPGSKHVVTYNENIFVGYRYYDTKNIETLFEFGHGLSYSTFSYSNLVAETKDGFITFKVDVKNTSDVDGYETVQIYSEKLNSKIIRAKKELIGFKKEFIKSNETKTIEFVINEEKLQFFSPITNQFEIEGGEYKIHISSSISKTECDFIHHVDCREIETNHILLSRDDLFLPNNYFDKVEVPKKFHMNATLGEIKHNFIGKRVYGMVQSQLKDFVGEMDENSGAALMVKAMVEEMPIRNLVMMSQGKISKGTMRMIIFCMNVFK